jgi:hypothetical protein
MPRTKQELETRLERVEKERAELKAIVTGRQDKRWHREIVGIFAGDKAFAEITRLGRLIRQEKMKG